MAGEWIKLKHETPDKPEIVELAGILNIEQDAAFGKCVRLWIWADQQSVDGNDLPVTPAFLDRLTNCPGFSQGLLKVGWLKGRNGHYSIPGFDRHNGQSAKARALTSDRVKRHRNGQDVTTPLPEREGELEKEEDQEKKPPNPLFSDPWFSDPEFHKAWNGWIAARKKKPTPYALELALGKLHGLAGDISIAREILKEAVIGGWTGLWPLKHGPSQNGGPPRKKFKVVP